MIVAIVQARLNSTRLPGKMLADVAGKPMLQRVLERIQHVSLVDQIVLATTTTTADVPLVEHARRQGVAVFVGSEADVLDRFYQAAITYHADICVRITGDCPLVDPKQIRQLILLLQDTGADYVSNNYPIPTWPDGMDVEVVTIGALTRAWREATWQSEREHVMPYIWKHPERFVLRRLVHEPDLSHVRLTVDNEQDLDVVRAIYQAWAGVGDFSMEEILAWLATHPEVAARNAHLRRNEGYAKSLREDQELQTPYLEENAMSQIFKRSDELCQRAQEIIPGGCHTYSKGADQSPKLGPKFIARGKGCYVWDVDGNKFLDWTMGLTAVSLGHAYQPVIAVVKKELAKGCNFQCPSPVEVGLAEFFLGEVPGAEMVKFAKNGSTVTTAAVKLARAYTGRKYVAFCADHGFFSYDDWYISKKPNNAGVPEEIAKLSLTFRYNDIKSVEELFALYPDQIACVILEPMEFDEPQDGFLTQLEALCRRNGTVFVIDEMITGFRLAYPGAHKMLGVKPDLTTWGKGIGNGFSACVLAGRREIMERGGIQHDKERVFLISTTHGAETHALAAALATIKTIRDNNVPERNAKLGIILRDELTKVIAAAGLNDYMTIKGHPCWQLMQFRDAAGNLCDGYKTLAFQEAIRCGLFFRGTFTLALSHTDKEIEKTVRAFRNIVRVYAQALDAGSYTKFLVGEPVKPVFRKFN